MHSQLKSMPAVSILCSAAAQASPRADARREGPLNLAFVLLSEPALSDRLYGERLPIEIDEDVREEYWTDIRGRRPR